MTMMAVTPIYGKKSSFPEPAGRFSRILGTPVIACKNNDDPGVTLTYFTARSILVT